MKAAVLVPAAGLGVRLGGGLPKALRELGDVPMLVHALRAVLAAPSVSAAVVAAPADGVDGVRELLARELGPQAPVTVVPGGATRQESVRRALDALDGPCSVVLVHDAARPFVPVDVVEAVVAAVEAGADAVVPALPLVDTVKEVTADDAPPGAKERVVRTVDRATLRAVQTPQGFRREVLAAAHAASPEGDTTDDAGMVERMGVPVAVVPGSEDAFKVTRPFDLLLAEALLNRRRAEARSGGAPSN